MDPHATVHTSPTPVLLLWLAAYLALGLASAAFAFKTSTRNRRDSTSSTVRAISWRAAQTTSAAEWAKSGCKRAAS